MMGAELLAARFTTASFITAPPPLGANYLTENNQYGEEYTTLLN